MSVEVSDGRRYMRDLDYARLDNDEASRYWTIQKGDLVALGEYVGEKSMLYEDELTVYAKEQRLDLIHITEYADNTSGEAVI